MSNPKLNISEILNGASDEVSEVLFDYNGFFADHDEYGDDNGIQSILKFSFDDASKYTDTCTPVLVNDERDVILAHIKDTTFILLDGDGWTQLEPTGIPMKLAHYIGKKMSMKFITETWKNNPSVISMELAQAELNVPEEFEEEELFFTKKPNITFETEELLELFPGYVISANDPGLSNSNQIYLTKQGYFI
jgi:hypothetical protein